MKRRLFLALSLIGLVTPALSPVVHAQESKTARGTVTALAANAVTVKIRDAEMKFAVSPSTRVEAQGGTHKDAAARAAGMGGAKLTDLLKVGDPVSVNYSEQAGAFRASRILVVSSAAMGGGAISADTPSTQLASGTVTSVAVDKLTINAGGKDLTFVIAASTHVVGTGVGSKTLTTKGRAPIGELVSSGDRVTVSYQEMSGGRHATQVRVTQSSKGGTR